MKARREEVAVKNPMDGPSSEMVTTVTLNEQERELLVHACEVGQRVLPHRGQAIQVLTNLCALIRYRSQAPVNVQRQDSTRDQLLDLVNMAEKNGMYDAADQLKLWMENR